MLQNIRFLVGFLFFQIVTDPSSFLTKVGEWFGRRNRPLLRTATALIGRRLKKQPAISNGNYTEFLHWYASLTSLQKLRNVGKLLHVQREVYFLTLDPVTRNKAVRIDDISRHRVLFIVTNALPYTQSGYTIRTHETAKALAMHGVDVQVVTRYGYPLVVGEVPSKTGAIFDGIRYWNIAPPKFHLRAADQVAFTVKKSIEIAKHARSNLILTTTDFHNAVVAQRVAASIEVPWVYEIRGEQEKTWLSKRPESLRSAASQSDRYRWTQRQEANYAKDADAVTTLGDTLSDIARARGVPDDKITEIPNAIDESMFEAAIDKCEARRKCGLPEGIIVGYVGAIVRYEGLEILLHMAKLDSELRVLVVGDGEDLPRLQELASSLGVSERVFFVGKQPVEEIAIWYACLDCFIVPREDWEVCRSVPPLKPLNAMALGIPVLGADLPALRYITGNLGVYVEDRDPVLYLRTLRALVEAPPDPELLIGWAKLHTWSRNAAKYGLIFDRLM